MNKLRVWNDWPAKPAPPRATELAGGEAKPQFFSVLAVVIASDLLPRSRCLCRLLEKADTAWRTDTDRRLGRTLSCLDTKIGHFALARDIIGRYVSNKRSGQIAAVEEKADAVASGFRHFRGREGSVEC
jgi:hypothetical protein